MSSTTTKNSTTKKEEGKNTKRSFPKFKDLPLDKKTQTVALLMSVEEKQTKNGGNYCRVALSDGESLVEANIWNKTKDMIRIAEKSLCSVEVYTKLYNDAVSYEVTRYGLAPDGLSIQAFVLSAPYKGEEMYNWITNKLRQSIPKEEGGKPDLVDLTLSIYEEHKEELLYWSAAKTMHHAIYGGLLYHTFRMLRSGIAVGQIYGVDLEVLLCGIALHDIGKLTELDTDELGIAEYSIDGNLFGHLYMGVRMVEEAVAKGDYNPEKVRMLCHLIASHHGNLEWGAIAKPATSEAYLLSAIDKMDADMYRYEEETNKLDPGTMSDRIYSIGGCVYHPDYTETEKTADTEE